MTSKGMKRAVGLANRYHNCKAGLMIKILQNISYDDGGKGEDD